MGILFTIRLRIKKEDVLPSAKLIAVLGSKGPWSTSSKCSIAQEPDFVNSHSSIPENHFATAGDHIGSLLREKERGVGTGVLDRPNMKRGKDAKKNPSMIPSLWDTSPVRGNQIRVHMQYSTED